MMHKHYTEVKLEDITEEGVKDMKIRWLISKKDGAKNFAMRLFEIQPGGNSPYHQHDWEHEIFILEGTGVAKGEKSQEEYKQGDLFLIPSMEWHQFLNTGNTVSKILCLISYKNK
jgi:quercetin dioxygenase-like cupin family protein